LDVYLDTCQKSNNIKVRWKKYNFFYIFSFIVINKMFKGKLIYTILALLVIVFAMNKYNGNQLVENFAGGQSFTVKAEKVFTAARPGQQALSPANMRATGAFYQVPGSYQSMMAPRFSNTTYGANALYNMPALKNQAVPPSPLGYGSMVNGGSCGGGGNNGGNNQLKNTRQQQTPLGYGNMITENYSCNSCGGGPVNCNRSKSVGPDVPPDYSNGNYADVLMDAVQTGGEYPEIADQVPIGDMTVLNSLGDQENVVVADRLMISGFRKNANAGLGDLVRGDIVPCDVSGAVDSTGRPMWVTSLSLNQQTSLQQGALNVMAGSNEASKALTSAIWEASGRSNDTIGGVYLPQATLQNYSKTSLSGMQNLYSTDLSANQTDVRVTAFP
jgi:hypothetical protein